MVRSLGILGAWAGLALLACGASSSGDGTPARDSGAAVTPDTGGGSSSGSSSGGSTPTPDDPSVCSGLGNCSLCCQKHFSAGAQFFRISQIHCTCIGASSCESVCQSAVCQQLHSGEIGCQTCIDQHLTGPCAQQATSDCQGDATCKLFDECLGLCAGDGG